MPILSWARTYSGAPPINDLSAAVIVGIMLLSQSLASAILAGLPPDVVLYASIMPILIYSTLGTSRLLAVGPSRLSPS